MPIKLIPKYISEVEAKLTAGNITEGEFNTLWQPPGIFTSASIVGRTRQALSL